MPTQSFTTLLTDVTVPTVSVSAVQTSVCVCVAAAGDWAVACLQLQGAQHVLNWDESTHSMPTVRQNKAVGESKVSPHQR